MAVNRLESTVRDDEPAAAEPATPAGPKVASGGFKAWLPLLVTLVAMPLLAFGMTRFVLLPQLQKGLGITPAAAAPAQDAKADPNAQREAVPMNRLLVNVAGTLGARYLLCSLSVVGTGADFRAKLTAHDPQLRDLACGILATKTLADLEKPGARNVIRSELISGFNNILGGALVQEIYLTDFAIQ